jgi:hypothetical protein
MTAALRNKAACDAPRANPLREAPDGAVAARHATSRVARPGDVKQATHWRRMIYPHERLILVCSVIGNLVIVALLATAMVNAPDWITHHPHFQSLEQKVTTTVVVVLLVVPLMPLIRRVRVALLRENSVQLGPTQVPAIYDILERECRALEIHPMPEVYVSSSVKLKTLSTSMAFLGGARVIVLAGELFTGMIDIENRLDVYSFIIGYELGRLRLGHAGFWQELFLGYLKRIPVVRLPLLTVQTFSRDRVSAVLAPHGIRGLLFHAGGGDILDQLDVASYVRKVVSGPDRWWWLASLWRPEPHVSMRVRALYVGGYFKLDRDLARLESGVHAEVH